MKNIEMVLETFIKNEINVTESRICAIRQFTETLRNELIACTRNLPSSTDEKVKLASMLKLFRSMITTYEDEIKLMMHKREKMLDYVTSLRCVSSCIDSTSSNLHIN